MIKRDLIHFNCRKIDGYNLPFNFIISEREAGKSTAVWLDKAYKSFAENGSTTLVVRRKVVHITKAYIDDIAQIINKFTDDKIIFQYSQSSLKEGIVDIYINEKRFMRVVALSIDITALKSLVLRDLKYIVFDEFIPEKRAIRNLQDPYKMVSVVESVARLKDVEIIMLANTVRADDPVLIRMGLTNMKLGEFRKIYNKKGKLFGVCHLVDPAEYPEFAEYIGKHINDQWIPKVLNLKTRMLRGKEIAEQINILGDDGVPVEYHVTFWKSEIIDYVILQQDAFDEVDAVTPLERQEEILNLVTTICDKEYDFETFQDVIDYFKKMINLCKQMNYSPFKSEQYSDFKRQVEEMLNA